ncbi:unnamed protein product [Vitrella brassicaformis CCMP3155]|uniref:Apple domain-containing protein n=2 Tax=Vitrella brassicaformis TaxID=1169539 RepID=A0A0G4F0Q6_VITBC|nr:unnamed protein product [Vitrella brassicaformis CCMP3155]|eukprot:CEM04640.1 unnamed protein product [Vitrella brassicaformis CCMP3155]
MMKVLHLGALLLAAAVCADSTSSATNDPAAAAAATNATALRGSVNVSTEVIDTDAAEGDAGAAEARELQGQACSVSSCQCVGVWNENGHGGVCGMYELGFFPETQSLPWCYVSRQCPFARNSVLMPAYAWLIPCCVPSGGGGGGTPPMAAAPVASPPAGGPAVAAGRPAPAVGSPPSGGGY